MPPADAKRVAGWVCVHLMAFGRVEIARLEQSGTKFDRLFVRGSRIVDVEIDVYLLRGPIWPVGGNVVRGELHADTPIARAGYHAVKSVVPEHLSSEHSGPERALGF
jgi:hypothetical protein